MDYHYPPLQAVFDGWILILLVVLTSVALVRLRGGRRVLVVAGFGLWILATAFWMPFLLGRFLEPLFAVVHPEVVWQLPLVPWLIGALLLTAGVARRPQRAYAAPPHDFPPPDFPPPVFPSPEPSEAPGSHQPFDAPQVGPDFQAPEERPPRKGGAT